MKTARKKAPTTVDSTTFCQHLTEWYCFLQPDGRLVGDRDERAASNLCKTGLNGVYSIIIALYWWISGSHASHVVHVKTQSITCQMLVDDLDWTINSFPLENEGQPTATMSKTAALGKRKTNDSSGQRVAKRTRRTE